jgi:hypothetical protein
MPFKETSMKKWVKLCLILMTGALVLAGCPTPFFLGAIDLAGKTLFYYSLQSLDPTTAPNGHDFVMLRFDGTGKAGDFEMARFAFGFATQAAVTANSYTGKRWFQNDGEKGTFTYDPAANLLTMTATSGYSPAPGAAAMTNGKCPATSFAYRTFKDYVSSVMLPVDAASTASAYNIQVTQDNLYAVYAAGNTANTWTFNGSQTFAFTAAGTTTTIQTTKAFTFTVVEASITKDEVTVTTTTTGTLPPSKETEHNAYTYSVVKYFLAAQADDPNETFATVWKKGNSVSFQSERTHYYTMTFAGDTPLTLPAPDPVLGNAADTAVPPIWEVDDRVTPTVINLTHGGPFIFETSQADNPGRALAAR